MSLKKNSTTFDLYRFQILPLNRYYQGNLFDNINSINELIEKKNQIFDIM